MFATKNMTDTIRQTMPNVPLYPGLSNHDFYPANQQQFLVSSDPWLVEIGDYWNSELGSTASAKIKEWGYYMVENPSRTSSSSFTNLLIIQVNT